MRRTWLVFIKTWRELRRDWWVLGLTLAFAPLFVVLYWLFTQGGSTAYTILLINQDQPAAIVEAHPPHAEQVVEAIQAITYEDGSPLLRVRLVDTFEQARSLLRDRAAVAYLILPGDFSSKLEKIKSGDLQTSLDLVFGGDLTNPYYTLGVTLALAALEGYVALATEQKPLINYLEQPLGASAARSEFEIYTPGVLVFAVIMLIFLAAMTTAREIESGTLRRLQITPLTAYEYLGGITLALTAVGLISIGLSLATALTLGFRTQGQLWSVLVVGAATSLAVIGVGLIVACFARTVSQAFVIANFPLGLFMFFSGAIFPISKLVLFQVGGREIGLFDILPPTHAVIALNKILTLGAGFEDVQYELTMLIVLSILYFGIGAWLFQHLQLESKS